MADHASSTNRGRGSDELILTAGILNYEAKSSYEVIVRTTDSGGLTYDKTITITVNDLNETPTDISISASTIDENIDTTGGTSIGTLSSTDPDAGDTFTYSIEGGADQGNFSIGGGGSDELILTAGILNYEAKSSYEVIVRTTDSGGLTFDKTITITVNDLNEGPVITDATLNVDEDSPNGTGVGNVPVTDPDVGDTHVYMITAGNTGGAFAIDNGGNITVANSSALDFETTPVFTLTVQVQDQGGTGLTDTATVTVNLNDLNVAPTAISLDNTTVNENASGAIIGNLTTTDPDAGDTHTYTVDDARFDVVGGQLKLKAGQSMNFETEPSVNITVTSTDGGGLSTNQPFTITVNDVNDAPTATNMSAPQSYTEDTPLNLIDIVVSDEDSANVTVTLTLSDPAAGTLSTGTSGAVTSTFIGGVWTASGSIADVNALLASVVFTPAANYTDNFTIATRLDDGVATPVTGIKNMTGIPVGSTSEDNDPDDEAPVTEPEEDSPSEEPNTDVDEEDIPMINEDSNVGNNPVGGAATEGTEASKGGPVRFVRKLANIARKNLTSVIGGLSTSQPTQNESATLVVTPEQNVEQGLDDGSISDRAYVHLQNLLDAMKQEITGDSEVDKAVVGSAIAVSTGLSVGYVVWLIRGGMLISSVLSSMPAWQIADPLPILARKKDDSDSDDKESLETILKKGSGNADKKDEKPGLSSGADEEAP